MKEYKIVMISDQGSRNMATFDKLKTAKEVFETVFKNSASETRVYSLIEYNDGKEIVIDSVSRDFKMNS